MNDKKVIEKNWKLLGYKIFILTINCYNKKLNLYYKSKKQIIKLVMR